MFWKSTYNELVKISFKPRSYLGVGGISLIIILILLAMKLDGSLYIKLLTGQFDEALSFEGNILNGNLIAFLIIQMLIIHIPLLVAFVTGESAMGTIRFLLTKPISRSTILFSKFMASCIYTFLLVLWLAFLALVVSHFIFGSGDLIVLNSDGLVVFQEADVLWRFVLGFSIAFLSLVTVATLSLMFSCFSENSIGQILETMGIIILFTIIGSLDVPIFDTIRPYLFTTHMAAWRYFFSQPLSVDEIIESVLILFSHIVFFLGIAVYKFNKKDILS
jgi:ABC-2 type transport system permease protein